MNMENKVSDHSHCRNCGGIVWPGEGHGCSYTDPKLMPRTWVAWGGGGGGSGAIETLYRDISEEDFCAKVRKVRDRGGSRTLLQAEIWELALRLSDAATGPK
jgi:hypothetical protein